MFYLYSEIREWASRSSPAAQPVRAGAGKSCPVPGAAASPRERGVRSKCADPRAEETQRRPLQLWRRRGGKTFHHRCWSNVGPASQTLDQHWTGIGSIRRFCNWIWLDSYYRSGNLWFRDFLQSLEFARLSSSQNSRKLIPREYYQIHIISPLALILYA